MFVKNDKMASLDVEPRMQYCPSVSLEFIRIQLEYKTYMYLYSVFLYVTTYSKIPHHSNKGVQETVPLIANYLMNLR